MSYDLCTGKQAEKPYFIENIRTGIYSLEELCFYLYNNICLIDESILNEGLCDWIRDELGLARLYRQLYEQLDKLEKQDGAAFFVLPIFREAGYLTHAEMREFQEKLAKLEVQSDDMKRKLRGDYLFREKMYARAIGEYREILRRRTPGKLGTQFYAAVLNNLGAAYAGLFQFETAAECFRESYELMKTKETLRKYISALPLFLDGEECRERVDALRADPVLVKSIQEYSAKLGEKPELAERIAGMRESDTGKILDELKEQYCRSTKI